MLNLITRLISGSKERGSWENIQKFIKNLGKTNKFEILFSKYMRSSKSQVDLQAEQKGMAFQ